MIQLKVRITAINMPEGTVSVIWNDDPRLEFNYEIPVDVTGKVATRDEFLDFIVANHYPLFEEIEKRKGRNWAVETPALVLDEEVVVTDRGESFRLAVEAQKLIEAARGNPVV